MSKIDVVDLTSGSIFSHLGRLAIPAALGMLFHTLYNIVDVFFAGMISTNAQAGLSLGYLSFFFIAAFGFGINAAMAGLLGNSIGKKDDNFGNIVLNGLVFTLLISLILIAFGWLAGVKIVSIVSDPGLYRDLGIRYYFWLLVSLPGFLIAYACNGILQAQGNTVSMQRAMVLAFFLNLILNPLLIFGVPNFWSGLGFDGLALSTVISNYFVMFYMLFSISFRRVFPIISRVNFNRKIFWKFFEQMLPPTMSFQMIIIGVLIMQFALKDFGAEAIAGYSIAVRIEQLILLPILGVTHALLPLVAQNFGAGKFNRVREAFFLCVSVGMLVMLLAYPFIWYLSYYAMALFTESEMVLNVGISYLRVDGLVLSVYAILFSINSLLQGIKRPFGIFWIGIFRQGIAAAFFIWFFISYLHFDFWGVWYGAVASVITGCLLSIIVAYKVFQSEVRIMKYIRQNS